MKRLPFNACDYRCERCLETAECAVFQKARKELQGRERENPASVLSDLRESFRETEEMIKQKARASGIDIDEIAGVSSVEEIRERITKTSEDALYKESMEFALRTKRFLDSTDPLLKNEAKEFLDDIAWHHTVVPAKIFRALGWRTGGDVEIAIDGLNSSAVAVKSLTICIMAFDHLASRYPEIKEAGRQLSAEAREIKENIKKRFKL